MVTIDGHTFDEKLINKGWIIDAGCRGFELYTKFKPLGNYSYLGIDIEDFGKTFYQTNAHFKHAALSHERGITNAYYFGNGTANFLEGLNGVPENSPERPCETRQVNRITLEDIYSEIGTNIDLLKLDVEAAEYEILLNMEHIPKQITVEFHQHTNKALHDQYIERVLSKMCKDYHLNLYIRDWHQYPYMDCLFIRKDLL
jgi:FkbM family methyltransferase